MLTEVQSVLGALRKPSCGDVAAYSAVCCISDFGIVVGDWTADDNKDHAEVNSDPSSSKDGVISGSATEDGGVRGVKGLSRVWKSMSALAKESTRRAA